MTNKWPSTIIGTATETDIASDSQLAIARPDKDEKLLRLFYQGRGTNGASGPLHEIRYDSADDKWAIQDNPIVSDAVNNTGLSAVSDKTIQEVRLYYQGPNSTLQEIYCNGDYRWDTRCECVPKQIYTVD
jgi:hypothetical protein